MQEHKSKSNGVNNSLNPPLTSWIAIGSLDLFANLAAGYFLWQNFGLAGITITISIVAIQAALALTIAVYRWQKVHPEPVQKVKTRRVVHEQKLNLEDNNQQQQAILAPELLRSEEAESRLASNNSSAASRYSLLIPKPQENSRVIIENFPRRNQEKRHSRKRHQRRSDSSTVSEKGGSDSGIPKKRSISPRQQSSTKKEEFSVDEPGQKNQTVISNNNPPALLVESKSDVSPPDISPPPNDMDIPNIRLDHQLNKGEISTISTNIIRGTFATPSSYEKKKITSSADNLLEKQEPGTVELNQSDNESKTLQNNDLSIPEQRGRRKMLAWEDLPEGLGEFISFRRPTSQDLPFNASIVVESEEEIAGYDAVPHSKKPPVEDQNIGVRSEDERADHVALNPVPEGKGNGQSPSPSSAPDPSLNNPFNLNFDVIPLESIKNPSGSNPPPSISSTVSEISKSNEWQPIRPPSPPKQPKPEVKVTAEAADPIEVMLKSTEETLALMESNYKREKSKLGQAIKDSNKQGLDAIFGLLSDSINLRRQINEQKVARKQSITQFALEAKTTAADDDNKQLLESFEKDFVEIALKELKNNVDDVVNQNKFTVIFEMLFDIIALRQKLGLDPEPIVEKFTPNFNLKDTDSCWVIFKMTLPQPIEFMDDFIKNKETPLLADIFTAIKSNLTNAMEAQAFKALTSSTWMNRSRVENFKSGFQQLLGVIQLRKRLGLDTSVTIEKFKCTESDIFKLTSSVDIKRVQTFLQETQEIEAVKAIPGLVSAIEQIREKLSAQLTNNFQGSVVEEKGTHNVDSDQATTPGSVTPDEDKGTNKLKEMEQELKPKLVGLTSTWLDKSTELAQLEKVKNFQDTLDFLVEKVNELTSDFSSDSDKLIPQLVKNFTYNANWAIAKLTSCQAIAQVQDFLGEKLKAIQNSDKLKPLASNIQDIQKKLQEKRDKDIAGLLEQINKPGWTLTSPIPNFLNNIMNRAELRTYLGKALEENKLTYDKALNIVDEAKRAALFDMATDTERGKDLSFYEVIARDVASEKKQLGTSELKQLNSVPGGGLESTPPKEKSFAWGRFFSSSKNTASPLLAEATGEIKPKSLEGALEKLKIESSMKLPLNDAARVADFKAAFEQLCLLESQDQDPAIKQFKFDPDWAIFSLSSMVAIDDLQKFLEKQQEIIKESHHLNPLLKQILKKFQQLKDDVDDEDDDSDEVNRYQQYQDINLLLKKYQMKELELHEVNGFAANIQDKDELNWFLANAIQNGFLSWRNTQKILYKALEQGKINSKEYQEIFDLWDDIVKQQSSLITIEKDPLITIENNSSSATTSSSMTSISSSSV